VIVFEAVTIAYAGEPALRDASFTIPEGELVLVVGPTGSGKTSLLRCLGDYWGTGAGVGPRTGAEVTQTGRVQVDGVDLRDADADEGGAIVRLVRQDPAAGLTTGTVESAIAAGVRPRADDPHGGQRQVEETLDLLGLADLRNRSVVDLSGGQQQRAAIGVALAAGPRVLVLDEPTSALDPVAAEEVLAILHRLVHDVGITVLVAEHRLERVVHHADSVLLVEAGRVTGPLDPAVAMARSAIRPPVVELGLRLGWTPLPLSVRAARRQARDLRAALEDSAGTTVDRAGHVTDARVDARVEVRVQALRLSLVRGQVVALRTVTLQAGAGEVVVLMGRNGAGKSSLLGALAGSLEPTSGRATLFGRSALAPQDPGALLTDSPVDHQLTANDAAFALSPGSTAGVLERLVPGLARDRHPAQLSEGQKMCVALSLVLSRGSEVVLLDEPTRGLDYPAKARLTSLLTQLAVAGRTVILATHDVELAAEVATRVVILAEGEVVADGPASRILGDSPAFAPQVAKVMHPVPLLRVSDVVG
jgi:energy-coupling factor transport system ATP-binding protein